MKRTSKLECVMLVECLLMLVLLIVMNSRIRNTPTVTYEPPADVPVVEIPPVKISPVVMPEVVEAKFPVPLDTDLQDYIIRLCEQNHIDPAIIIAMIDRESDFRPGVIGDNGQAFGLMQIQPRWHQDRMDKLGVTDLLDPYQNVAVGIDYLAELRNLGRGTEWALMAYNGGHAYADRLTSQGMVSDYATEVMANAKALQNATTRV